MADDNMKVKFAFCFATSRFKSGKLNESLFFFIKKQIITFFASKSVYKNDFLLQDLMHKRNSLEF